MSTQYRQLTQKQRYQIAAYRDQHFSVRDIAECIGCSASTVSRELRRNQTAPGHYDPDRAQAISDRRRCRAAKATKGSDELTAWIVTLLDDGWTPEQIAGRLALEGSSEVVSHEWIYRFIERDKASGGQLYRRLPRKKKRYRKRYGAEDRRGRIQNRVGIEQRPALVDERRRIGDWEGDTVHGVNGSMVTLTDRCSGLYLFQKVERRTAEAVSLALIDLLQGQPCHTLTLDNGQEFAHHERVSQALGIDVYFADPYRSCQRGSNENANGLMRRYWPKGSCFKRLDAQAVRELMLRINRWPRKRLGYRSPFEVFYGVSVAVIS